MKHYSCLIALAILSISIIANNDHEEVSVCNLPEPYSSIKLLPFDDHGWFGPGNQRGLNHFIRELQPKVVIELGSWLGASTIFMAKRVPKGAVIYAVDNWNQVGSAGVQKNALWSSKLPTLYQTFLSNVIHAGCTQTIIPVRMDTQEASLALNVTADLIYVDASHEEEDVYNDIISWYPHLAQGGIMCGDDWSFPSVKRAIMRVLSEINQDVNHDENFWWFNAKA